MNLRWTKRKTEYGNYILQMKAEDGDWYDIPCENEEAPKSLRAELAERLDSKMLAEIAADFFLETLKHDPDYGVACWDQCLDQIRKDWGRK